MVSATDVGRIICSSLEPAPPMRNRKAPVELNTYRKYKFKKICLFSSLLVLVLIKYEAAHFMSV